DRVFYSITNDPAKGTAYLKLVNATSTPQPIDINITGATPGSSATLYTLSGKTTTETNTIDDPKRIVPVKSSIKTAAKFSHTIPPYAIQVVVMEVK
ncbi:MAG TPA: alpha-L-arabinofuranosidase C-terminal domain-containing protein, partial [Edaphobacter sp.]